MYKAFFKEVLSRTISVVIAALIVLSIGLVAAGFFALPADWQPYVFFGAIVVAFFGWLAQDAWADAKKKFNSSDI